MAQRGERCKACDGTGLLADDEFWQYTCTVCGGDGLVSPGESPEPKRTHQCRRNKPHLRLIELQECVMSLYRRHFLAAQICLAFQLPKLSSLIAFFAFHFPNLPTF